MRRTLSDPGAPALTTALPLVWFVVFTPALLGFAWLPVLRGQGFQGIEVLLTFAWAAFTFGVVRQRRLAHRVELEGAVLHVTPSRGPQETLPLAEVRRVEYLSVPGARGPDVITLVLEAPSAPGDPVPREIRFVPQGGWQRAGGPIAEELTTLVAHAKTAARAPAV